MEDNYLIKLFTLFKNVTLNAIGAERDLYKLIADKDVTKAIDMMQDNDIEVDNAIREYNPQLHKVMHRRNKKRKNDKPYITEKLPRTRQRYINEVELFFLLGKPIVWTKKEGSDEAFMLFKTFLTNIRFDALIRRVKRLAGAETESALVYNITKEKKGDRFEITAKPYVVARSLGYKIRPMFDQYGDLIAFGIGYRLRMKGKNVMHWDIHTKDWVFYCKHANIGWEVESIPNPTGKINVLYFKQPKAWDGVVPRIEREELLDSKTGDTNNYFSDPMAAATADVIDNLADPDKPGRLIQLTGTASKFEYINPPQNSITRQQEKLELEKSILFDSLTPDLSYENIKGLGSLSGVAMHNALILGYIKRDIRKETYDEMLSRFVSVTINILSLLHPEKTSELQKLKVAHDFQEPFEEDENGKTNTIVTLYQSGLMSLDTAIRKLSTTDNPSEEVQKILSERKQNENNIKENKGK